MVKHIILWDLKEDVADKEAAKKAIKEELEGLLEIIPGLIEMDVYINPIESSSADLCLVSILEDRKSLEQYTNHPAHLKVANEIVRPVVTNRKCFDFEI